MSNKSFTVYIHTTPSNKVYIGITSTNVKKRWGHGCNYHGMHFENAIKKYGWDNIKHEILFEGLTEEEAKQKEIELIKKFDSTNCNKGYNVSTGGDTRHHSEETRKKMSVSRKGKAHSKEWVDKIANAQKTVPVLAYTLNGNFIREHKSIMDCARFWGLSESTIRNCCNGEIKQARGTVFMYKDPEKRKQYVDRRRHTPIMCIDTGEKFFSVSEACKRFNARHSCIYNVLKGKRNTWHGLRFVILDESEEVDNGENT